MLNVGLNLKFVRYMNLQNIRQENGIDQEHLVIFEFISKSKIT